MLIWLIGYFGCQGVGQLFGYCPRGGRFVAQVCFLRLGELRGWMLHMCSNCGRRGIIMGVVCSRDVRGFGRMSEEEGGCLFVGVR